MCTIVRMKDRRTEGHSMHTYHGAQELLEPLLALGALVSQVPLGSDPFLSALGLLSHLEGLYYPSPLGCHRGLADKMILENKADT